MRPAPPPRSAPTRRRSWGEQYATLASRGYLPHRLGERRRALVAIEPTLAEVAAHSDALALGYNDPDNARLMGHAEPISADEVVEHYEAMAEESARQFLLFLDGKLMGDADLRGIDNGTAEFAFMIGARDQQGKASAPSSR